MTQELNFDTQTSSQPLLEAVDYYRKTDGQVTQKAPKDFLDSEEQERLFDEEGKFKRSLYKVLLFHKITLAVKSGAVNLQHSMKYLSFDQYLIPKNVWTSQHDSHLQKANLGRFANFQEVQVELKKRLHQQYQSTNDRLREKINPYANVNDKGELKVTTPQLEKDSEEKECNYEC